jgi:hypothetical protein
LEWKGCVLPDCCAVAIYCSAFVSWILPLAELFWFLLDKMRLSPASFITVTLYFVPAAIDLS